MTKCDKNGSACICDKKNFTTEICTCAMVSSFSYHYCLFIAWYFPYRWCLHFWNFFLIEFNERSIEIKIKEILHFAVLVLSRRWASEQVSMSLSIILLTFFIKKITKNVYEKNIIKKKNILQNIKCFYW